jgi:hypothetical protein
MKKLSFLFLFILFLPSNLYAVCSTNDYTVIYINGVRTNDQKADEENKDLERRYKAKTGRTDVTFINGHNPSRIASIDDFFTSVSQAYQRPDLYREDFDLKNIILEIQPKITTRKILIIGYYQGTFYANALYKYLITHGVPEESVTVYNVATPASYVSGEGDYITATTDTAINFIRELTKTGGANKPLPANTNITRMPDDTDMFPGHSFLKVYLPNETQRIIGDVGTGLSELKASESSDGACFEPPEIDAIYKFTDVAFKISDPIIAVGFKPVGAVLGTIAKGVKTLADFAQTGINSAGSTLRSLFFPANTAAAIQAFDFVRTAYGSSLTREDLEELNENSPSVQAYIAAREEQNAPVESQGEPVDEPPTEESEPKGEVLGEFIQAPPLPPAPVFAPATSNGPLVGAGGGGGSVPAPTPEPDPAPAPPPAPVSEFSFISPDDNASFATTSIDISGTAPANGLLDILYGSTSTTATADGAGAWSASLIFAEGTTTISVSVYEDALAATSSASRTVYVELPPPPCVVPDALDLGETWNETFTESGGPYVIDGDVYVRNGNVTMDAGTVFKFKPGATVTFHADVNVDINGTQSSPVLFTSLNDDADGDTNCDDAATTPAAGDWGYASFGTGAWNSSFSASYFAVRYGGGKSVTTANDGTFSLALMLTYQKYSGSPGVDYSLQTIEASHSADMGVYAYVGQGNSLTISNSSFHDNGGFGFYRARVYDAGFNAVAGKLDAKNNWWGDASGPLQVDTNPAGLGDELDAFASFIGAILFDPWLATDPFSP